MPGPAFNFDNTYARELEGFYLPAAIHDVPRPQMLRFNRNLAAELDAAEKAIGSPTEKWTDTAHEWRYIVPERSWVSEDLLRNEIQYQPEKEQ